MAIGRLRKPFIVRQKDGTSHHHKVEVDNPLDENGKPLFEEHELPRGAIARVVYLKQNGRAVKMFKERCKYLILSWSVCETVKGTDGRERPSSFTVLALPDTGGALSMESLCNSSFVHNWTEVDNDTKVKSAAYCPPCDHSRPSTPGAKRTLRYSRANRIQRAVMETEEVDIAMKRNIREGNVLPVELETIEYMEPVNGSPVPEIVSGPTGPDVPAVRLERREPVPVPVRLPTYDSKTVIVETMSEREKQAKLRRLERNAMMFSEHYYAMFRDV